MSYVFRRLHSCGLLARRVRARATSALQAGEQASGPVGVTQGPAAHVALRLAAALTDSDTAHAPQLGELVRRLVSHLWPVTPAVPDAPPWLREARRLIEAAPESASLGSVARAVLRHPVHLARAFRRNYHISVRFYVRALRLQRAAQAMACTSATLGAIAHDAGFYDHSHLVREFVRWTGMRPSHLRHLLPAGASARACFVRTSARLDD